jgi:beta-lactam-binding protein with PASTA domain
MTGNDNQSNNKRDERDRSLAEKGEQDNAQTVQEDLIAEDKEQPRPKKRRRSRTLSFFRFLFQLAVTTVFVFALLAGVGYFTLRHFIARKEVQVPNLAGLTLEEALPRLKSFDLALTLEKKEYSDATGKGEILAQYPYPGTRTKVGNAVKVILSEGTTLVEVPNVKGETFVRAGIRLRAADLQVGNVARVENRDVPRDSVIAEDPPAGSGVPRKQPVNLLLSEGESLKEFLMPNLVQATLKEAQAIIAKLGISIEKIEEVDSPGAEKGAILAQKPPAGETIRSDTKIALTVASGLDVLRKH